METTFQIKADEFTEGLFDQLKTFIKSRANAEITISIKEDSTESVETKKDFFTRLDTSIEEVNRGEGTLFTMTELEKFVKE